MQDAIAQAADTALFLQRRYSLKWAPRFAEVGTIVIDNSSAWRLSHPLIVPEINGDILSSNDKIIANPNCSTIQLVMALKPLHDAFQIKRVMYQPINQ